MALSPWVRPLAYCEINPDARAVLLSRMRYNEITAAPLLNRWSECIKGGAPVEVTPGCGIGFLSVFVSAAACEKEHPGVMPIEIREAILVIKKRGKR